MKSILSAFFLVLGATHFVSDATAGEGGYRVAAISHCSGCADSKFTTPRYNQLLQYRHSEDRKRYNAAPCCGERVRIEPYLLKTVVVSKRRVPHYVIDAYGNQTCRRVLTTTYKKIYSDGSCYVWTEQG